MVIARNHPEHIGKLARRIHHLYVNDKTEENHWLKLLTVDRSGPQEKQGNEVLDVHLSRLPVRLVEDSLLVPAKRRRLARSLELIERLDVVCSRSGKVELTGTG